MATTISKGIVGGMLAVVLAFAPFAAGRVQATDSQGGEEQLTVSYRSHGPDSPVRTQRTYSGTVTVIVSGTGQAAGSQHSDAFYIFGDAYGRSQTVMPANEFGLYINGRPAAEAGGSRPSYQSSHGYTFTINTQGQPLTFAIGEHGLSDNSGSLHITVREHRQPRDSGPTQQPRGIDAQEWVTVDAARNTTSNPARSQRTYSGVVTIQTEGIMQTSGTSISDSYYILTNYGGQTVTPIPANEFSLYVNGRRVSEIAPRAYQNVSTYRFTVNLGNTPQQLTFAIGDRYLADNAGFFRLAISGQNQPPYQHPDPQPPQQQCFDTADYKVYRQRWEKQSLMSSRLLLARVPIRIERTVHSGPDSDDDGIADAMERALGTDPYDHDSDNDGYDDKTEILNDYDPNGPGRKPIDVRIIRQMTGRSFVIDNALWYVDTDGKAYFIPDPCAGKNKSSSLF